MNTRTSVFGFWRKVLLSVILVSIAACANPDPKATDMSQPKHVSLGQWKRLHPTSGYALTSSRTGGQPSQDLQWELYAFRAITSVTSASVYDWDVERAVGVLDSSMPVVTHFDSRSCPGVLDLLIRAEAFVAPGFKTPKPRSAAPGMMEPAGPAPDGVEYTLTWSNADAASHDRASVSVVDDGGQIEKLHNEIRLQLERCKPT